jgi:hypothetical protein
LVFWAVCLFSEVQGVVSSTPMAPPLEVGPLPLAE